MLPTQAAAILRNLGFRFSTTGGYLQALRTFQGGYNLGGWLTVDGLLGPGSAAALTRSEANRRAGRPTASASFSFADFRCGCGGRYTGCRVILVRRELFWTLERYRVRVGGPVRVVSGYRCPTHNRRVGGASSSQHLYGTAADVGYALTYTAAATLRVAAGIGRSGLRPYKVRHLDRRDVSGHNLTGGTTAHPTIWVYPQG